VLATLTFLGFIALAGILFLRMLKTRAEHAEAETELGIERPKRMSSRERKLAKIKEFEESLPPRPTIQELMAEEVRETGVDRIPGGDGLEIPVRLKVWHRDEHVRQGCADGALRFVVSEGVDLAAANEDDVMLVCDAVEETTPTVAKPGMPSDGDDPSPDPVEAGEVIEPNSNPTD
jgi:hypothetical protein